MEARRQRDHGVVAAGWVQRCYPAVLETWHGLSPVARVAAQLLYTDCRPGELVEIVHGVFFRRLPCADETSSRDAFARLEAAGILRCVFRSRGCTARTIYRLGDPVEAHKRRGLGVHDPDPQLLLPFSDEDLDGGDSEDVGVGILRLFCGKLESGNSPGFNAPNPGEFPDSSHSNPGILPDSNQPIVNSKSVRAGCQSAETVVRSELEARFSAGNGEPERRELGSRQPPTFCVRGRQESQDRDLSSVKRQEEDSSLALTARRIWEQLRAQIAATDWESYLARCHTESDQGGGLVIVAPDEWSGERVRRLLRGAGLLAGVTIRSEMPTRPAPEPPAHVQADCGRVWMLRINQAVQDCGGRGDTALPQTAVEEAARYLAQRQLPAKRVDRLLEKVRQRRPRNPGGWLNTGLAELCAQCGLPWRQSQFHKPR